jgi:hypothetical protein
MNSRHPLTLVGVAAALASLLLLLATGQPAWAAQDSCDQCKYLKCLKSTVERKQNLIQVYQGLQNFWQSRNLDANGKPLAEFSTANVAESQRAAVIQAYIEQLSEFAKMEKARTEEVPPPEGCGYPNDPSKIAEPGTNILTCETTGVVEARAQQPCKELADLIAQHEGVHQQACEKRKAVGKLLTPAGKAADEIAAYQVEIAAINKIIEKLKKKCGKTAFNDITVDCVIKTPRCSVRSGEKISGHVCGDPTKETWVMEPKYFVEGCGMPAVPAKNNKAFNNDCLPIDSDEAKKRTQLFLSHRVSSGGGGWMCLYSATPTPKITIRWVRMNRCEGPAQQDYVVDAEVSESCDEESPPPPTPPGRLPDS